MNDSPRRDQPGPPPDQQPTQHGNQGATDPAYAYPPPLFGGQDQVPTQYGGAEDQLPAQYGGSQEPGPTQHATGFPKEFHEAPTHPPTPNPGYPSPADANPTRELPPPAWQPGGYDPSQQQPAWQQGGYEAPQQPPAWQQGGYDASQSNQYNQPWTGGQPPQPPYGPDGSDGDGGGSRMWLWVLAGVAVLLVIGLVAAVLIVTSSSEETVVAPPLQPTATATTTSPRTTSRAPAPSDDETTTSTSTSGTGVTEEVVYNVGGEGKAINITYIDDGGVLQTEFNVTLPWTKTVQLEQPAKDSASVSVLKLGGQVTCSLTIAGAEISKESGRGLTMCKAPN